MQKEILSKNKTIHFAQFDYESSSQTIILNGNWDWQSTDESLPDTICKQVEETKPNKPILIDATQVGKLDTSGAMFLKLLIDQLSKLKIDTQEIKFKSEHQTLYDLVKGKVSVTPVVDKSQRIDPKATAYYIGQQTFQSFKDILNLLAFLGAVALSTVQWVQIPLKTQFKLICEIVINDGYKAAGIISLLSFLIGIVLAYQTGAQLLTYGANIFVVNLLGLSLLREFAPLITAIIVAGRSGSAFAAHIGTMKAQEEIDALQTMGISPFKRLVSPRIIGLIIALTLLTVLSDITSVLGGMFMSKAYLNISFMEFLTRFQEVIAAKHYILGLIKAPVFAILIAIVGCYRGFCVQGSAASIGQETTRSVVLSIFLIIVADAAFSILYSTLKV
ncbi:ABC transporter permease [Thiotrichales bacterium 19S11-10]|nr:ABC transporter permease [Thiotrichales bacterium 19S11-10]